MRDSPPILLWYIAFNIDILKLVLQRFRCECVKKSPGHKAVAPHALRLYAFLRVWMVFRFLRPARKEGIFERKRTQVRVHRKFHTDAAGHKNLNPQGRKESKHT